MGKIGDFTKEELLNYMRANGEIHRFKYDSPAWKHAFHLCKAAGNHHYSMDCSSCPPKVKAWLEKDEKPQAE